MIQLVADPNRPSPYQGGLTGAVGANSSVTVLG
jgi:hypothetical protein